MRKVFPTIRWRRVLAAPAAAGLLAALSPIAVPVASAQPCPDVEVIFARGTTEPPGVGGFGQAFVDGLRAQAGARTVTVYPVDYPASTDFPTAGAGIVDASRHISATAANCPATKMVLGGYSQGAAVIGYVTTDTLPTGFALPAGITGPMPAEVADHVAAVVLFGKPSTDFLRGIDAPPIVIGARYAPKTLDLCAPGDPICTPGGGGSGVAHAMYAVDGMVGQGVGFAAAHL